MKTILDNLLLVGFEYKYFIFLKSVIIKCLRQKEHKC